MACSFVNTSCVVFVIRLVTLWVRGRLGGSLAGADDPVTRAAPTCHLSRRSSEQLLSRLVSF